MNATERQAVRLAIDQAVRARIAEQGETGCVGCGGEIESSTKGCKHCSDRHRSRQRRKGDHP